MLPRIGITTDADPERYFSRRPYADAVVSAAGIPILIPCIPSLARAYLAVVDGIILSGGDDPIMEPFGVATHPKATRVDGARQDMELALLDALRDDPAKPVLGICLGMQYMCLHAGGAIDQYLPETLPTHELHWGRVSHPVRGDLGRGDVLSHHRQAVTNPGSLHIAATAPDGTIEAVRDRHRRFFLGVQWHPERTADAALGLGLVRALVEAAQTNSPQGMSSTPISRSS